jgi:outer membrane protein OmpA-like peptidoglycan-associated protein
VEAWIQKKFPGVKAGTMRYFGEDHPVSLSNNASNRRVELTYTWEEPGGSAIEKKERDDTTLISKLKLDKLYFIPDKAILEAGSVDYLNQMIDLLKKYPQARFEIRGHVNKPPYNKKSEGFEKQMQQLSEDRARFVYQACLEHGIAASRMTYQGMGSTEMEYPNPKNDDEKRMNMRVEILVFGPR